MFKSRTALLFSFIFVILLSCKTYANPIFVHLDNSFNSEEFKLTFYIGLNDREKYVQIIDSEKAEKIVTEIFLKYTSGFTILKSKGVWNDGKETTFENGFVVMVYFDSDDRMYLEQYAKFISEEITEKLNQTSVLVEFAPINSKYYERL